jgi:AP-3 complex subunit sigma
MWVNLKDRDVEDCNIIEDLEFISPSHKVVYRKYFTLFFVFVIDEGESELASIDLIQNIFNLLEKNFTEVNEFELVFHPDKVSFKDTSVDV